MDETGIDHQSTIQDKAWSKRGQKVFGEKRGSTRGRTSIIAGYKRNSNNGKLIAPFYFNGNTTGELFIIWLRDVLLPVWDKKDILVMDNAS